VGTAKWAKCMGQIAPAFTSIALLLLANTLLNPCSTPNRLHAARSELSTPPPGFSCSRAPAVHYLVA
jgi:hypothetical protein